MIGIRETDRCDSCARPWTDVHIATTYYSGSTDSIVRARGAALCHDCNDGTVDAIGLVSAGEFAINRMEPIPCGDCGGELSEAGLRRIYIDGATLPLCDACFRAHGEERFAKAMGISLPAARAFIATRGRAGSGGAA